MINVIIDESLIPIDKKILRLIVCCVEYETNSMNEEFKKISDLINDPIRFKKSGDKVHYANMIPLQKNLLVELISKLSITVKIYIYYRADINDNKFKLYGIKKTIDHLNHIHKNKLNKISLEPTEEYENTNISKYMDRSIDKYMYLVPDILSGTFSDYLSDTQKIKKDIIVNYDLLREKIRLQYFNIKVNSEQYLIRDKKI